MLTIIHLESSHMTSACITGPNPPLYPLHHLLLFKLSTLQDLSLKMCYPPPSSSACKLWHLQDCFQDIPLLSYAGLDLCLVLVLYWLLERDEILFIGWGFCFCQVVLSTVMLKMTVSTSHVVVGIFLIVYSSIDPINITFPSLCAVTLLDDWLLRGWFC